MVKYLGALIFGIVFGAALATSYDNRATRQLAIENNCGGYQHSTGQFQWETCTTIIPASQIPVPPEYINPPRPKHKPKQVEK